MSDYDETKRINDIADECYRLRVSDGPLRERAAARAVAAHLRERNGMGLSELQVAAHANAVAKGFYEAGRPTFGELVALAHSELSEALEAYRERGFTDSVTENGKPEGVASELADTVIRIADMCGALGIDLNTAVVKKMAYNATRTYRHGGKRL